nr:hypothetical protein GCM10017745_03210 [Saccharothrix mutabilis subsp. capreolus]
MLISTPWWAFAICLTAAFLGGATVSVAWRGRDLRGQHSFHAPEVSVAATINRVMAGNRLDAEAKTRETPTARERVRNLDARATAVIPATQRDEKRHSTFLNESTGRHHRLREAS